MTATKGMREITLGMTNLGYSIDDGFAEALRESPNQVFGRHSGWDFNGRVWFSEGLFHEEVWTYGSIKGVMSAQTLQELMRDVSNVYGRE